MEALLHGPIVDTMTALFTISRYFEELGLRCVETHACVERLPQGQAIVIPPALHAAWRGESFDIVRKFPAAFPFWSLLGHHCMASLWRQVSRANVRCRRLIGSSMRNRHFQSLPTVSCGALSFAMRGNRWTFQIDHARSDDGETLVKHLQHQLRGAFHPESILTGTRLCPLRIFWSWHERRLVQRDVF